jgi:hypothetical protein
MSETEESSRRERAAAGWSFARPFTGTGPLVLAALLVALYAAARLWRLAGPCLWFDEIFGVHAANHTWSGLWSFVAADLIHPPLFYALLKLWIGAGGESILWLELFAYFFMLAALVPFFLLARELGFNSTATNLSLLLLAVGGYFIKYAQEVRMYALLFLLGLTSLWLFAKFLRRPLPTMGMLAALFVVNLLLVYTHYYGWLLVCGEAVYLLLGREGRKLKGFAIVCLALVACFAPWVYACAGAAGEGRGLAENVGWIERPTLWDALGFYGLLHEPFHFRQTSADPAFARGGTLLGALLFGLPLLWLLLRTARGALFKASRAKDAGLVGDGEQIVQGGQRVESDGAGARDSHAPDAEAEAVRFLAFFSLFPVVVSFAASHLLPYAIWGTRHLIVAAGPYVLLAGLGLARLRPVWLRACLLGVVGCWFVLAGVLTLARPETRFIWCTWGELAGRTFREEAKARRATDIYAFEDLVGYQLWHELRDEPGRFRVAVVKGVGGMIDDPSFFLPRRFPDVTRLGPDSLTAERFWIAFRAETLDPTRPPLDLLAARGYRIERTHETTAQGQRAFLILVSRAPAP